MVSTGDCVRAYNSPTDVYEVIETGVEKDVSVPDGREVWRLPNGNTLLQNTQREGVYLVVKEKLILAVD